MWEPKPEGLKLVCGECGGDLGFDVIQGEITVELCDTCSEEIFGRGLVEGRDE